MKSNLCILAAVWLAISGSLGFAQTNTPAPSPTPTPAPAAAPASDAQPPAEAPTPVLASSAAPAPMPSGDAMIPLIVMDEVPLTDAIKNLARQAELNYMLDPKIAYGQAGPDGKAAPQPMVSVRWENITAAQALTALLNNYNLQLVPEPKSGIARITMRDPAAPAQLHTKIIQLKYASPTNVASSVQFTLVDKRSRVAADIRTSQLVVLATEVEMEAVDKLVDKLDTPTKQVLIEARMIETSVNPTSKKGVNWTGTLNGQNIRMGNNLQENDAKKSVNNTLSDSMPKMLFDTAKGFNPRTAFLDADGVSAVLSFLNTSSEAKVLSTPRTVTLDNETASISVTRASPIFKNTAGTQGSPGGSEVTYTNLGVILNVTPRITANNYVNLRVVPEVSRVFNTVSKVVNDMESQADQYDIRKIETQVLIPSGNTLVLGGLVQDDVRTDNTKVPVLGDIPVLGRAFRSDSKSRQKSNLIIFITPTIIDDTDFQPTKTDFLKSKVPTSDSIEADWSAMDSGKPKKWRKTDSEIANDDSKFAPLN